jgi:hypothetical protein
VTAAKALASLVGQPLVVDELSLVRDEPIRVKVNCRNPGATNYIIEVFFKQIVHDIKFMAEGNFGKKKTRYSREDPLVETRKMISQREKTLRIRMVLKERESKTSLTEWVGSIGSKNQAMGTAKMLWRKKWSLGSARGICSKERLANCCLPSYH